MGGKHKQANRTKNNARPSSSSHTAELLGNTLPTYFGLSAVKDGTTIIPGFSSDDFDYNIDSNFQLVLKKMNKKDSTTKLKALQEFTELCKNSEIDAVKTILPFWPRLYCLLCTDVEHRVREAAHNAHRAVISKVKKSIAPYLKQIAGPWFTSQYDTYPPAASAATLAFQEAFSPTKLNEAIVFCQEEILSYIYDNLINHTPQTLSTPKTSPEEMEAKYQRVIIASLQGYSLYLQRLSPEQVKQAEVTNKKLLASQKFWKYSKNKAPAIRNSFFNALISLCQNAKFLLEGESAHVSSAIFNNLDESDPMVLPTVWDAALNVLVAIEDCWAHVNLEKQVFPKLYVILRDGGRGNGTTIFPNILPLLSKLPSDLMKDKNLFYGNLFENMKLGLEVASVNQSHSEGKIIATTFIECLKYIIMCNCKDLELCKGLISNNLIRAIEEKITSPDALNKSVTIPLFSQVCGLMRYWHRNRQADGLNYEPILTYFLTLLHELFDRTVNQEVAETTITTVLNNQMEFLIVMKNPNKSSKIKGRVKFLEEKNSPEENVEKKNEPDDLEFVRELQTVVKKIASTYFKNTIKNHTNIYLPFINKLVQNFDSKIIFEELMRTLEEDSAFKLYSSLFSKWMDEPTMRTVDVIELLFSLLQHVDQNQKEIILKDFNEKWFNETLQYDICRILLKYSDDACVKSWVRSENFAKSILDLTEKFVSSSRDNPASRDVIVQFFKSKTANEELIIGSETANSIINIVSENVRKSGRKNHVNELAQDLVLQTPEQFYPSSFNGLISSLFKLSCYTTDSEKLLKACKTGLRAIIYASRCKNVAFDFTENLAEVIREIVFCDEVPFQPEHIISLINTYVDLATNNNLSEGTSSNSDIQEAIEIIQTFLKDPLEIKKWRQSLIKSCKTGYQNRGDWDLRFLAIEETKKDDCLKNFDMKEITENLIHSLEDEYDSSETLKFMNFSTENLDKILKYRRCYNYYNAVEEEQESFISVDLVKKYAKWNIFVGGLLKLVVSAHPRSYKNYLLNELNVYCINDEELAAWKDENKNSDLIPIKITTEEKEEMQQDLKVIETDFNDAEYQDKNNIVPICNHVFDFVHSFGLLSSFSQFYSSTKYYKILQEPLKKLKTITDDVFRNANALESLFCYYSVKYFVVKESDWRMILPTLKEVFHRNFLEEKLEITLEEIEKFIETDVSNKILTVNKLLKIWYIVVNYSKHLSEEQWHQIFIFMDGFFQKLKDSDEFLDENMHILSAISRLQLQLIKSFKENHLRPMDDRISPEACLAWNEVVKSELFHKYFSIWLKLTEKYYADENIPTEYIAILENISQIVLSDISLKKYSEEESIELLKQYGRYITSPHAVFQVTSFQLLLRLVPDLVKLDTNLFCNNISQVSTDTKEGSSLFKKNADCDWTCKNLEEFIVSNHGIVETLLSDFIIGDCCTVEPFTDSFSYTYSYLLLWCFILEICGEAHSPLRFQYGCWLSERGYSTCLLESVFKLMPQTVLHGSEAKENSTKYFENHASLDFLEPVKSERIEQTACYVYRMFLQRLPNVVRNWWSQAENKTAALVDKITTLYVSPILISNELKSVQQDQENGFENVEIKTHLNAREVIATYTIDEVKMDLMMTLPQNHPLSPIKIDPSNVVVSTSNWRNLQFLISKYLINQNGTIWGALVIWKNYLDKKFEGVEECYICFSILQGATHDIPKLCCHTCRKKFHSHCLFKWFSTSNKSTCPICRNLF